MALNLDTFYDLFRVVVAPEFEAKDDDTIDLFVAEAEIEISETKFGKRYPRAIALVTAHLMKMAEKSTNKDEGSGPLKSVKVGDISREWNVPSDDTGAMGSYQLTNYGKEYLRLRKQILKTPLFVS